MIESNMRLVGWLVDQDLKKNLYVCMVSVSVKNEAMIFCVSVNVFSLFVRSFIHSFYIYR